MVSEKFRRQLRQEATRWQADGLISSTQLQQLSEQYQFETLETAARDRFGAILILLGSILLGIGVITFVAANWQLIPRSVKVAMLVTLFLSVNGAGFYLWQRPVRGETEREGWQQRLGQGLLLLGGLILGGNLALLGQMFHQSGSASGLCLVWGSGVLAMAFGLRLTSLGMLAALLLGIGYWLGISDQWMWDRSSGLFWVLQNMPLLAGGSLLPLAYWCRSRALFLAAAIAVVSSLVGSLSLLEAEVLDGAIATALLVAIVLTLPVALLWGYDDALWQLLRRGLRLPAGDQVHPFRPLARRLGVVYLCGATYLFSFHWLWRDGVPVAAADNISVLQSAVAPWVTNAAIPVLTLVVIVEWVLLGQSRVRSGWRLTAVDSTILGMLLLLAVLSFWHFGIASISAIALFLFNAVLFVLGVGLIREGLADGQRSQFWFGLVLITLQVLSRVMEYNTGLLLKSFTLLLCGVAIIGLGLWFERYIRTFSPSSSMRSLSSTEEELS